MATICSGRLSVSGPKQDIGTFKDFAWGDEMLDAQKFIPLEEVKEKEARNRWGTTLLGFCEPYIEEDTDSSLIYGFHTQNTPALPVVNQMGVQFPDLDFRYDYWEPQMAFIGFLVMKKGRISQEVFEYKHCPFWLFERLVGINWSRSKKVKGKDEEPVDGIAPYILREKA